MNRPAVLLPTVSAGCASPLEVYPRSVLELSANAVVSWRGAECVKAETRSWFSRPTERVGVTCGCTNAPLRMTFKQRTSFSSPHLARKETSLCRLIFVRVKLHYYQNGSLSSATHVHLFVPAIPCCKEDCPLAWRPSTVITRTSPTMPISLRVSNIFKHALTSSPQLATK